MSDLIDDDGFTASERSIRSTILAKDSALREFLAGSQIDANADPHAWLTYLTGVKNILGNLSNDVGFVATLLIKRYLQERFGISDFDAGGKAQGAAGIDIEATTPSGLTIVGELKTTKPYQPGFGAQQRTTILKDLDRLHRATADHRLMFVTDAEAFRTLCSQRFAARAPNVEVIDLVTGQSSAPAQDARPQTKAD